MTDAPPAVLLIVPDPAGDVRGDGSYVLPSALLGGIERSLDLRELRAENTGGKLRLVIGLGGADNPWNAPSGFSAVLLDVFIKTDFGGVRELADTGFTTPPGSGWHVRYQISGFSTKAWTADRDGRLQRAKSVPQVRLEGSSLVVNTDLPAGRYGYWVTSRVYSPLTPEGYLEPRVGGDSTTLAVARSGLPSAVDVLYADDQTRTFQNRVLPISGELHDRRPLVLIVLSGLGLALAMFATVRAWRKQ